MILVFQLIRFIAKDSDFRMEPVLFHINIIQQLVPTK